ncbi:hypothetical protein I315_04548 [Cryptococcus gattii Ru294]|nr:hypothetical protein I315_04548 [Cryptococcus gattii Ru294]
MPLVALQHDSLSTLPVPNSTETWNTFVTRSPNTVPNSFLGIHELFHLAVGLICGGQVISICIDPNDGGATHIMGLMRQTPRIPRHPYAMPTTFAQAFWSASTVLTLGAGYFGSSVVGFLFVFCGFDIVASKACALVIHIAMLVPVLRADHWIAFASIIACEIILIGLWFGDHGNALRFYVIFVGMMNLFYVVWDYVDERLFDKRNTSDCAQFSELLGWPTSCKSYPTALSQIFHPSASFKMERVYLPMWEQKGRARREAYH